MTLRDDIGIVIVAAGTGRRFGGELPKQFCLLDGKPVVTHCIERFKRFVPGAHITVVLPADRMEYWHELKARYKIDNVAEAAGGDTRWQSVKNALAVLPKSILTVMIHDGARPLVDHTVVNNLLNAVKEADGALPVLAMTDSLRRLTGHGSSQAVNRADFYAVQTPQVFPAYKLKKAYDLPYDITMTDDASVMEAAGYKHIVLCQGDESTLKITRPIDLDIAHLYLSYRQ